MVFLILTGFTQPRGIHVDFLFVAKLPFEILSCVEVGNVAIILECLHFQGSSQQSE
jgi:hypothetical protein